MVIVRDGRTLEEVLKIERLTEDEIKDAAREQGIGDLRDISVGIMEADGKFSFLRFDDVRPPQGGSEPAWHRRIGSRNPPGPGVCVSRAAFHRGS